MQYVKAGKENKQFNRIKFYPLILLIEADPGFFVEDEGCQSSMVRTANLRICTILGKKRIEWQVVHQSVKMPQTQYRLHNISIIYPRPR